MSDLLSNPAYFKFLSSSHPELSLKLCSQGAPYFVVSIASFQPLMPGVLRSIAYHLRIVAPSLLNPRALVFGVPFEPYEQTAILSMLPSIQSIKKMAKEFGADVVLLTNVNKNSSHISKLLNAGFLLIPSFPDMRLKVNAQNFEDYLNLFSSKYRNSMRRNIKKFEREQHRLIYQKEINKSLNEDFYQAYRFMRRRALVPWIAYSKEYFASLSDAMPDSFVVAAHSARGEFLGMAQGLKESERFHVARVATAQSMYRKDGIFFRLIYASIEHALNQGCKEIILSPTSYAFKRKLGAQYYPLYNLILPISFSWKTLVSTLRPWTLRALVGHLNCHSTLERVF
ncbi:MAG: GNAT family N-acetyltransferase [Myxococcales bacterium]|nr:GNAT family N-acetyltransferase [Myxococcales bacterium]USN51310.1 MAG: GNAT family N-acetyltransferase [Myxococcales bacterium]